MQKVSIRKLSILGLVLMAASAVTAAIIPSKSDKKAIKFDAAGSLTFSTVVGDGDLLANRSGSISCELDTGAITAACNVTVATETSEALGDANSTSISTFDNDEAPGAGNVGQNNTSDT